MKDVMNNMMNQLDCQPIFDQLLLKFNEEFKSAIYKTFVKKTSPHKKVDVTPSQNDITQPNDDYIQPHDDVIQLHDDVIQPHEHVTLQVEDDDYFSSVQDPWCVIPTLVFTSRDIRSDDVTSFWVSDEHFPELPKCSVQGKISTLQDSQNNSDITWAEVTKRKAIKLKVIPCNENGQSFETVNRFASLFEKIKAPTKVTSLQQKLQKRKQMTTTSRQFTLIEKQGNVFKSSPDSAIACPVDEGMHSTSGLGLQLETRYHMTDVLRAQAKRPGQVGVARSGKRLVLSIVTKRAPQDTPTLQDVLRGFEALKKCCLKLGVHELAMPRFSVQDTTWFELKRHIRQIFCNTDVCLIVYSPRYTRFTDSAKAGFFNIRSFVRSVLTVAERDTQQEMFQRDKILTGGVTSEEQEPKKAEIKQAKTLKNVETSIDLKNDGKKTWRFYLKHTRLLSTEKPESTSDITCSGNVRKVTSDEELTSMNPQQDVLPNKELADFPLDIFRENIKHATSN